MGEGWAQSVDVADSEAITSERMTKHELKKQRLIRLVMPTTPGSLLILAVQVEWVDHQVYEVHVPD